MKLSRFTLIGMGAVGLLLVVWLGLMFFTGTASTKVASEATTDDKHCPVCGRELPKAYIGTGECPYCEAEKAAGKAPPARQSGSALRTPLIPTLLIGAFCILLTTHGYLLFRTRFTGKKEEALYHTHCRKCGRKLRYRKSQAGQVALCPLCRQPVVFPRLLTPSRQPRWRKLLRLSW